MSSWRTNLRIFLEPQRTQGTQRNPSATSASSAVKSCLRWARHEGDLLRRSGVDLAFFHRRQHRDVARRRRERRAKPASASAAGVEHDAIVSGLHGLSVPAAETAAAATAAAATSTTTASSAAASASRACAVGLPDVSGAAFDFRRTRIEARAEIRQRSPVLLPLRARRPRPPNPPPPPPPPRPPASARLDRPSGADSTTTRLMPATFDPGKSRDRVARGVHDQHAHPLGTGAARRYAISAPLGPPSDLHMRCARVSDGGDHLPYSNATAGAKSASPPRASPASSAAAARRRGSEHPRPCVPAISSRSRG